MARTLCIALQLMALAFAGLAVAVLAVPFSAPGLANVPSRMQAGLFLFSRMPVEGMAFLGIVRHLVWVPVISAVVAFFPGNDGVLRLLRLFGVLANLAGLGYLILTFPEMLSGGRMPVLLYGIALLFAVSALMLLCMGQSKSPKALVNFLLAMMGAGSVAIFIMGCARQNAPVVAWGVMGGCAFILALAFWGLIMASQGGGKKRGGGAVYILAPLGAFVLFLLVSPPLALPVGAGGLLFAATRVRG